MNMRNHSKVIVIGLDGADWRLLEPWIQDKKLPTIAKLVSEGVTGKLRSTIRPESSVAWSSFSTGVNPGKHGVFGFMEQVEGGYSFQLANGSSVRARRFWEIISDYGLKVGLLNIPFTYPPAPVNGFMVTGMLTPGPDVTFTYPHELGQLLLARFGKYAFDVDDSTQDETTLVKKVLDLTYQQQETALFLLQEESWDLLTIVFIGPDRLQHFLWAHTDPHHPFHNAEQAHRFDSVLLEHYQLLDEAIAKILTGLPDDILVLLISDHGFNGCAKRFYVNHWLYEQGWLKLKEYDNWRLGLAEALSHLRSIQWLRRLKHTFFPDDWSSIALHSSGFAHTIDWENTKAYFGLDGGLRLNLYGRSPKGIVRQEEAEPLRQELYKALLAIEDPKTGRPVLSHVFSSEELYHGPFVSMSPDLILEPQRDNLNPIHNFVLDSSLLTDRASCFGSSVPYTANHSLDGIFVGWGAGVTRGNQIEDAHIIDIAPTVLAALEIPVPNYMDGRMLSEIFSPDSVPVLHRTNSKQCTQDVSEKLLNSEEELVVEKRLRNLGYLE
jgi:predicted AlkP superfamily phosphohydrolase/phosphomutase